ncbi:adenylate/guanylate cyclase domain-containing protein [Croceicoccus naphthovorans]|uniref:Guanylate cyclase n=1 Tax=Croceicoccus naphthovorans TaxID=1348774 RepID=A0A0G3XHP0_9SPHN|nr:adenylate/guanylate cyclase domain-containing protein [Croceicoccus naphthovorans]AKM10136.1 guanylate cyclase [Croceicoccus naphthovorans]MBB3991572.1 adenylate cyclase [Croceicoccus naphthovorans]
MPDSERPITEEEIRRKLGQTLRQLGGTRVTIAALLMVIGALVAYGSWNLPLLRDAERALYDVRAVTAAEPVDTDERITLVVYTDDTNRATGQISPVDRTVLAQALANIDTMQPKAIGIDVLFDSPQDDDPLLKETLGQMVTPTWLAYATNATNPEAITFEQQQDLDLWHADVRSDTIRSTSILLETDSDGVARRWPRHFAGLPPLMSVAMTEDAPGIDPAFAGYTGPIRYRVPVSSERPVFDKIPIDLLADPATAEFMADLIKDRYVLIGGDFADFDQFDTPFTRTGNPVTGELQTIGVEIHATMLAQLLDSVRPLLVPGWLLWVLAAASVLMGAASAAPQGGGPAVGLAMILQFSIFLALPFLLESWGYNTYELPSVGWIGGWLMGYLAIASALRVIGAAQREFAAGALGKYLPKSVASEILRNPEQLRLHGEKREIYCVFTDLEGFTKLTHAVSPEVIASLLNQYLDHLSAVVLKYGGTLDKFVGDAVVAFWGAPISKPDDGYRAAMAACAMYEAGEAFRKSVPDGVPPIGRTRVGMHYGVAIVGNFGGEGRIQYTALGDAMNTAARLEAANKALDTTVLVSGEAIEKLRSSDIIDWFVPMGRVTLRGRATPVDVFEPRPDCDPKQRDAIAALVTAHRDGDAEAVQRFTDDRARIGQQGKQDAEGAEATSVLRETALRNLIERLRQTRGGESYVIG